MTFIRSAVVKHLDPAGPILNVVEWPDSISDPAGSIAAILCVVVMLARGPALIAGFQGRDVAEKAGLTAINVTGDSDRKEYILESTGAGVAIFDFDNHGLMDVFLVNGTSLDGKGPGEKSTSHLYRRHSGRLPGAWPHDSSRAILRRVRIGWSKRAPLSPGATRSSRPPAVKGSIGGHPELDGCGCPSAAGVRGRRLLWASRWRYQANHHSI